MGEFGVTIGDNLVLADAGGAARAPGHNIRAAVEPAFFPRFFERCPNHVVVLVGEGEITAAQLGQPQLPDDLFYRIGDGFSVWPGEGDDLLWVFE